MTTDPFTEADVERARDEIAGWQIGSGYYALNVGSDEAREMARAVLASLTPDAMRAQAKAEALREAADFLDEASRLNPSGSTPMYISAMGLRQRADQIEEAKSDG
jgi:hypothetical protein